MKILAICMSICFLMLPGMKAEAADSAAIVINAAAAERGGTVQVNINLSNNPGIWGMKFKVGYDHDALTLLSANAGTVFSEGEITPPQTLTQEKYLFMADRTELSNTEANGTLISLVFEVKKDAEIKDYPISLEIHQVINVDGNDVETTGADGKISVVECLHDFSKQDINDSTLRSQATLEAKATYFYTCKGCGAVSKDLYFEYGSTLPAEGDNTEQGGNDGENNPENGGGNDSANGNGGENNSTNTGENNSANGNAGENNSVNGDNGTDNNKTNKDEDKDTTGEGEEKNNQDKETNIEKNDKDTGKDVTVTNAKPVKEEETQNGEKTKDSVWVNILVAVLIAIVLGGGVYVYYKKVISKHRHKK